MIGQLIERRPDFDPHAWLDELPPMTLFGSLLFQITGQQLSVAATRRTIERITSLFEDDCPRPRSYWRRNRVTYELRGFPGARSTRSEISPNVSRMVDWTRRRLRKVSDDEFIADLTAVPGIGPWTAQGALLVALRREDVVLPGDLALRKAIRSTYHLDHLPDQDGGSRDRREVAPVP